MSLKPSRKRPETVRTGRPPYTIMEAKKREMINEERTVIDEDLIIQAVLEERKYNLDETIPDLKVEEDVVRNDICTPSFDKELNLPTSTKRFQNLDKIDSLSLTHKKIFSISNLDGFNLRKLVLNSNIIEKIEGLDHLVNLEWLDLSFNRISKIEGLDNLVNLKDLSLHKNKITKVEGLDNLKKLQILSLGENEISSMGVFQDLRKFKSLRVVNLREEFKICWRKSKEQSNAKRSDFTLRIQEIVEGYQTKLQEFVDKEKDRIEEDEEDEDEVSTEKNDEEGKVMMIGDDDEDDVGGDNDDDDEMCMAVEALICIPYILDRRCGRGEDDACGHKIYVDEDELDDMTKLLKNDEKLKEAISGSHSMQKDFIDELNRNRVAEIFDVVDLYRKVIKMCEMVDDDEDEEEEDDDSAT
eukprot:jgi/Bigna1/141086/aug1.60_g15794